MKCFLELLTDNQEQYYVYVDDKAQRSTALFHSKAKYDYLFIPYCREYPNGYMSNDWATSYKKETDIVVVLSFLLCSFLLLSDLLYIIHSQYTLL